MATAPTASAAPPAPAPTIVEELEEVLALRGQERTDRLLGSDDLSALVARMPPEELYFTLKEMSEDHVPAVLTAARPTQVQFLLDLELWRRDRLRTDRVGAWLRRLAECDDEALARWVVGLEATTWALLLGSAVKLRVREEDENEEPFQDAPGRPPFTVDGVHYVQAPEELEPFVHRLLKALAGVASGRYHQLMEALRHEVDSEFEEQCHDEKERRLSGHGFPSWEEAYHVYARLTDEGLRSAARRSPPSPPNDDQEGAVAPHYPIAAAGVAPDLLARALLRLGDSALDGPFRSELACLTNKVLVADGLDVEQIASFQRTLAKVAGYVSIGLEILCGPDEEAAARALSEHWLEHLFRAGWTRVREAQHHARRFVEKGWPQGKLERLLFLDPPLPELIDALLRRQPLWHAGEAEVPAVRDFRTLSEVQRADRAVEKADFLGRFLLSVVDFRLADLQQASVRLDADNLRGRTVFLTALVNAALGREFRFAPVERRDARQGLAKIWREDAPPRRARPELAEAAVDWSRGVAPVSGRDEAYLREFVAEALALLEEEFGHLAPDEAPDPRFTKGLWIV